jgi:HNH endonuclease
MDSGAFTLMLVIARDCTYCGLPASDRDHVIPVSFNGIGRKNASWTKDDTVPACKECNSLLHNFWLPTIAERAGYISRVLKVRYKDVLSIPAWSEEDLEELGYKLRKMVRSNLKKKKLIEMRIVFADLVSDMNLTPRDCW